MRLKCLFVCVSVFFLSSCASSPKRSLEYVSQYSVRFENVSRDALWTAALKSVRDMEFKVRREIKSKGFIDAQAEKPQTPDSYPPVMSIILLEEGGGVKVNCLVAYSEKIPETDGKEGYVALFFDALNKNLEKDSP